MTSPTTSGGPNGPSGSPRPRTSFDQHGRALVFCRTRRGADRVARQLGAAGVRAVAIHGDRTQGQRQRALDDFAGGKAHALVATDVAARGIHIDELSCVVHFDLPADPTDYVHRSGRTGRAGNTGTVVSLVTEENRTSARTLQRALGLEVGLDAPGSSVATGTPGRPPATGPTSAKEPARQVARPARRPGGTTMKGSGARKRTPRGTRGVPARPQVLRRLTADGTGDPARTGGDEEVVRCTPPLVGAVSGRREEVANGTSAVHLWEAAAGPGQEVEGQGEAGGQGGPARESRPETPEEPRPVEDQSALLEQFARLHEDLADGRISIDDFEVAQEELRSRLQVD